MTNREYISAALDRVKIINMIEAYLEGDAIRGAPGPYVYRATHCKTDQECSILIRDILLDNWHCTQSEDKQYIIKQIIKHIYCAEKMVENFPNKVKIQFQEKHAALKLALFGHTNFKICLANGTATFDEKMSHADYYLINRLYTISYKTDQFYRIKMQVAEAMRKYIEHSGIFHTRTAAAIRILNIDAISIEDYKDILNAELASLSLESKNSNLARDLELIMKKENILKDMAQSEANFECKEFNQYVSQLLLHFEHTKENLTKQPLYFIRKHFQYKEKDINVEILNIGGLGHAILQCKTADDYELFIKKLETTKTNIKNIEPELLILIQHLEDAICTKICSIKHTEQPIFTPLTR